ncbi:MAG: MFS transporter [Streptosporangiaceae bacterium]
MTETGPDPRRWRALPLVLVATFMASFDYMVVNVALPAFGRDLHAGQAALELVVGGYAFTYASGMVTGGKLGDLFGHRRVFVAGMAAFTLASVLCGISASPAMLVSGRLLQGLGAAAMAPQVLALITSLFPTLAERARALSWFGVALGLGGVCGQVCGGLLLDADVLGLSWRALFLVNVPIGAVTLLLAWRLLPGSSLRGSPSPSAVAGPRPRLDLGGVLGVSGSLALVLVPLTFGREQGWPAWTWASMAAAVPAAVLTLRDERRRAQRDAEPLLDLQLFRSRSFSAGLGVNVALMATFSSLMFTTTLLVQQGLGLSARDAGLLFLPLGGLAMVSSLSGRALTAKYGLKVLLAGTLIDVSAMAVPGGVLLTSGGAANAWRLAVPLSLFGFGSGLVLPSLMGVVLSGIRPARAGAASGVLTTTQQFSGAIGIAVLGQVFFAVLGPHPDRSGFVFAAATTAWVNLGLSLVVVALAMVLSPLRQPSPCPGPECPAA